MDLCRCHSGVYSMNKSDILRNGLLRVGSARFDVRKDGIFPFIQYIKDLLLDDVTELMRKSHPITKKDPIKKILKIMEETKQSDLPLINQDGHLIGQMCGMNIMKLGIEAIKNGR
jgi:hypothetical protein